MDSLFSDGVNYTDNVLGYMGNQIRTHHNPKDYPYILNLFKTFSKTPKPKQTLSWTLVSWVDTHDKLRVDAKLGILNSDKEKDVTDQPHILAAKEEQWKVKLAEPQLGNTSHKWIIPAALGVANDTGDYIGSLIFGFEIAKLRQQFSSFTFNKKMEFALIGKHGNIVTRSSDTFKPDMSVIPEVYYLQNSAQPIAYINPLTGKNYLIYKTPQYPYAIYLSYNPSVIWQGVFSMLRQNLLEILLAAASLGFIIWFFYARILKPVVALSQAANAVASGAENVAIPRTKSYEMFSLARAILRTKFYKLRDKEARELLQGTNRELKQKNSTLNQYSQNLEEANQQLEEANQQLQNTKSELENALQIIRDSDKEKEAFLRDLQRALDMPITAIINGTNILRKQELGPLNYEDYSMIFDAMNDAGRQLETLTTEFLNPSEVNVSEVLGKCITIQRRYATEKGMIIKTKIPKRIPLIWADKLRLRQILLSTLHHAMIYVPTNENQVLTVTAKVEKQKTAEGSVPAWLEIKVKNDGYGFDEETRIKYWDHHISGSYETFVSRDPNMINLDIETLRHLVGLHHGTFELIIHGPTGNSFVIRIPYLNKEDLEIHPVTRAQYIEKARVYVEKMTDVMKNSGNVIVFPNRKKGKEDT